MAIKEFPKTKGGILTGIGASLVAIGLGIGSGEFILWPFLSAKYGFGILWLAIVGIGFQVFLNIEIQRYSVVTGKSAVAGFLRLSRLFSFWLLFSMLAGFGWPGFASGSAYLIGNITQVSDGVKAVLPFVVLGVTIALLVIGTNSYKRIEKFFRYILPLSFLYIAFLVAYYYNHTLVMEVLRGFIGEGKSYRFFPEGIDLALLLGAFAYAGSGGNLLLGQGYYVLAKGHGMADYGGENHTASESQRSLHHFSGVKRFLVLENIVVFGLMGLLTIVGLSYLGPVLLGNNTAIGNNLGFLVMEANRIGQDLGWVARGLFLLSGAVALFAVQLGVLDTMGRIATDIAMKGRRNWYKLSIAIQGIFGVFIFALGLKEPLWLITMGAVCNALAMAVIAFSVLWMNSTHLPKLYRPKIWEQFALFAIGGVYTIFFVITVISKIAG